MSQRRDHAKRGVRGREPVTGASGPSFGAGRTTEEGLYSLSMRALVLRYRSRSPRAPSEKVYLRDPDTGLVGMRLWGSRPPRKPPPSAAAPPEAPDQQEVERLFDRKVELYPQEVRFLWFFFHREDAELAEGAETVFPGPVDEVDAAVIQQLDEMGMLVITPDAGDFGLRARLTRLGLQLMASQPESGRLSPVRLIDPSTGQGTVYQEAKLGE